MDFNSSDSLPTAELLRLTMTQTSSQMIQVHSASFESLESRSSGNSNALVTNYTPSLVTEGLSQGPSEATFGYDPENTLVTASMGTQLLANNGSPIRNHFRPKSSSPHLVPPPIINAANSTPGAERTNTLALYLSADDYKTRERNLQKMLSAGYFNYDFANPRVRRAVVEQLLRSMDPKTRAEIVEQYSKKPMAKRRAPTPTHAESKEEVNPKRPNRRPDFESSFVNACWKKDVQGKPQMPTLSVPLAVMPGCTNSRHVSRMDAIPETSSASIAYAASTLEPTCPKCHKGLKCDAIRPYTHQNQKDSFYRIFRCCGREFSNMSTLSGTKNRQFKDLTPVDHQLHEWKYHHSKTGLRKWKLTCRGQDWTRCEHCKALFKDINGKNNYRTKNKCPWAHLHVAAAGDAAAAIVSNKS